MTNKIRLLIADDHEVVRSGLKSMLAGTEIKVVGEVASGSAAVKYALENEVDVVLLDIRMPDGDGLTTLGRIKLDKPDLPIMILSREELRRVTGALATPRLTADVEVPLTQRESEVLRQLAYGLTNKEIAIALHISYETVKEHVQHILRKIGVSDRTQAAVWAVRKELV